MVIDVDGDGDEVVAKPLEEHQGIAEELREAELLGEENDQGVVPLTGGLLEAIEGLPKSHAIAGLVGGRDIVRRSLHEATTTVWKGGVQEGSVDVKGVAHHRAAVGNSQHRSFCREADRRRKGVEVIETVHLREAASYEPRFVLIEAAVCVPLEDEYPLASNGVTAKGNEAPLEHTQGIHCR